MSTTATSELDAPAPNQQESRGGAASEKLKAGWLFVVGLGFALLYWLLRSCSLDEWDSVLFAQGVLEFDLSKHQPHPPGYPLYIFFGRVLAGAGFSVQQALVTISAVCGGIYIATWLAIVWKAFGSKMAFPFAFALAGIIGVSLTAGKALTDMPASAFMALQLWFCLQPAQKRLALVLAAVCGAIAAGFRPQNVGITLLLVLAGGWIGKRSWKEVALATAVFAFFCLAWLLPMMAAQAQAMQSDNWMVYFERVNNQWTSRFTRPNTFIGAGDWSFGFLGMRFIKHFAWSWFYLGFGFDPRQVTGILGYAAIVAGIAALLFGKKAAAVSAVPSFWKWQFTWAIPYVLTIFICLPADPRYYVPIFPLILLAVLLGFQKFGSRGSILAWAFGALAWLVAAPLAWQMHREMPPPVQAMEWLRQQYPEAERAKVWVWLNDSYRHAVWYAPEFGNHSVLETEHPPKDAIIYSELAELPKKLGTAKNVTEVAKFSRPRTIHRKHETVALYRIEFEPPIPKKRKQSKSERGEPSDGEGA